jgi:glycosyltransferase involved in cell wall biosynthesis
MAKVNIIIRAFNRLEYTITTIREIDRLAGYDDYKIIVINQNSTDGTKEWLNSIVKEGYYKVKVINLDSNSGDFGGTKIGYDNLDSDCVYAMQWDNDCAPLTDKFLEKIVDLMDNKPNIGQLMLKREGVGGVIQVPRTEEYNGVIFGDSQVATCVNIQRVEVVKKHADWTTINESGFWDFNLNAMFKNQGYRVCKTTNIKVWHLDVYIYERDPYTNKPTKEWNAQGGIGIHHISAADTIKQLKKFGL